MLQCQGAQSNLPLALGGGGWGATLDLWLQGGENRDINLNAKHFFTLEAPLNPTYSPSPKKKKKKNNSELEPS